MDKYTKSFNIGSPEFLELTASNKKDIIIKEFTKCRDDFEYYISNYASVNHPNKGILKITPFDFQLDLAVPITIALKYGRNEKTYQKIKEYKRNFQYKKWFKDYVEKNIELQDKIPEELHDYYNTYILHPDYDRQIDTIVLKSRQTAISTIFQHVCLWHSNFYEHSKDIIISKNDKLAIEFMKALKIQHNYIPNEIKASIIKSNSHEFQLSITGDKSKISSIKVFPPSKNAGVGESPNMVILDEFSLYPYAEELWGGLALSLSGGGIIVIISTPRGIGNYFHQMWSQTLKKFSVLVNKNKKLNISKDDKTKESNLTDEQHINFRPVIIHWSQLPLEEFKRRGCDNPVIWYERMSSKLSADGGPKQIAQELDLAFHASGDTMIPGSVIAKLQNRIVQNIKKDYIISEKYPGLQIYEEPEKKAIYVMGTDSSSGIGKDYSTFYVFKIDSFGIVPILCAEYWNNNVSPYKFSKIVYEIGNYYNQAYLNPEKK